MRLFIAAIVSIGMLAAPALADKYRDRSAPITVAQNFDLGKYLGLWYEIARFPNRFERGCAGVTAEYGLRDDGAISVTNTCRKGGMDGDVDRIEGKASVKGPAKLRVNFVSWLPFAAGDYWILYVDNAYSLAVVGEPKGNTGWILARNKKITQSQFNTATQVLSANGYDVSQLELVQQ